jgi:hypothetical protein
MAFGPRISQPQGESARGGGGMGMPQARGIPWQFEAWAGRAGGQRGGRPKVLSHPFGLTAVPLIGRFIFRSLQFSDSDLEKWRTGGPGEVSQAGGAFANPISSPRRCC